MFVRVALDVERMYSPDKKPVNVKLKGERGRSGRPSLVFLYP
jgi:hypothetical protein